MTTGVLPYRTDAELLLRWLEARARDPRARAVRGRGAEGAAATAAALGLTDRETGALSAAGERLVLASAGERPGLLAAAMEGYEPYRALMAAARAHSPGGSTEVGWMESWWGTNGYGGSRSNREEATATLGRLVEYAGLGRYIPGRRGHPTRIEWSEPRPIRAPPPAAPPLAPSPPVPAAVSSSAPRRAPAPASDAVEYNHLTVPLSTGATARLQLPVRLPAAEKERLLSLLRLLIVEEGD